MNGFVVLEELEHEVLALHPGFGKGIGRMEG